MVLGQINEESNKTAVAIIDETAIFAWEEPNESRVWVQAFDVHTSRPLTPPYAPEITLPHTQERASLLVTRQREVDGGQAYDVLVTVETQPDDTANKAIRRAVLRFHRPFPRPDIDP